MRPRLIMFLARNWKFFGFLACLFFAVALAGCTGVASWITSAPQIISIAGSMALGILSFAASLVGKTLTASTVAKITAVITDVEGGLNDIDKMVAEYQATVPPPVGLLAEITTATQAVIDNINAFMADTGIDSAGATPSPTQKKIIAILDLVLSEVESFASLIPIFGEAAVAGSKVTITIPMSSKAAKDKYNAILTTSSGDAVVDAALAKLKKL
jgi:hypothetical protein